MFDFLKKQRHTVFFQRWCSLWHRLQRWKGRRLPSAAKMCFGRDWHPRGGGLWKKRVCCLPTPLSESASLGRHSRICISDEFPGAADGLWVGAPHPLELLSRTSFPRFSWIITLSNSNNSVLQSADSQCFVPLRRSPSQNLCCLIIRVSAFYSGLAPASITVN